jgi:hypothetical protein
MKKLTAALATRNGNRNWTAHRRQNETECRREKRASSGLCWPPDRVHEEESESLTEKPATMNSVGDENQIGLVGPRKITME